MTKEERAEKWFREIPNAETIDLEKKMAICARVAKGMGMVFFMVLFLEIALLIIVDGGWFFIYVANVLDGLQSGMPERIYSKNYYKVLALIGGLMCLPLIILPLTLARIFKNRKMQTEALKLLASTDDRERYQHDEEKWNASFNTLGKIASDWVLNIDGREQKVFMLSEIVSQLTLIKSGVVDFIILTPQKPIQTQEFGRWLSFVQVRQDKNPNYFHFEIATTNEEGHETMIYGKDGLSEEETKRLFQNLFEKASIPDLWDWEIVF